MIAIIKGESSFIKRIVSYCIENNVEFRQVDCFRDDLIDQIEDCYALIWHHSQTDPSHLILAKSLLFSLEQSGKTVFPNFNTGWHFDDKLGQKYLFEALSLPLVKTYIFYSKDEALKWAMQATFPKVFKLRRGAGSANVLLIRNLRHAKKQINKAFGNGFSNYNSLGNVKERWRKWRLGKLDSSGLIKGMLRLAIPPSYTRVAGREVGYVYFQDFICGNDHDIRVVVIASKAFAIKRMVRRNDFRASGSGNICYEKEHFNREVISLAFNISQKLNSQCTAMDFVIGSGKPLLIEISYGFVPEGYDSCPGYWDNNLGWHEGAFDPYGWIIEEIIKKQTNS